MKVLTVDDEEIMLKEMEHVLRQIDSGIIIDSAKSSSDAEDLAAKNEYDAVFLDIDMPVKSGMELAKELKEINEKTNIIFVTGFADYAVDAFDMFASGYVLKPINKEQIERALNNLRFPIKGKGVYVQCFGSFDIFIDGKPVRFRRSKTKELLAYLIDRRGASVNTNEIYTVLWQDDYDMDSKKHYLRNLIAELRSTLEKHGAGDLFVTSRNSFAIDANKLECDYYNYLNGDPISYTGEYMQQYSWAENTHGVLEAAL